MKVLFISEFINAPGQGAYMVANAHYNSLCDIFGKKNIDVVSIKTNDSSKPIKGFYNLSGYNKKIDRFKNLLLGYPSFMSKKVDKQILNIVKDNKYDLLFFDNSYFGTIIRSIKKYNSKLVIWSFYHGVKGNSARQIIRKLDTKLQFIVGALNCIRQEKLTTKYSDKCIVLNDRENNEFKKYYEREADFLLPVYYNDTAKIKKEKTGEEFRILFLGGYFWPNVVGIKWFAENVMPFINKKGKLYIVGRDMQNLNDECFNKDNIEIIGTTNDLDYWYNTSHIAVGPIFDGDGMKTKTAESLMYGKKYIGTNEALCGYIGLDKYRCNTAEEFIILINDLIDKNINLYDSAMRKLYEDNYSPEAAKKVLKAKLKEGGLL